MFEVLLFVAAGIAVIGLLGALDGSRDVFHPLIFISPMMVFLYFWMPWKLHTAGGLDQFFDSDQLLFVQRLNVFGIVAFVIACLSVGVRVPKRTSIDGTLSLSRIACKRLLIGAAIAGGIGFTCWSITIVNVGGFVNAFSASYSGGWDDSGYVRDGSLLLLVGVLLSISALSAGAPRVPGIILASLFGLPWLAQAILMARRGPTFAIVVIVLMGWYINREKRPPLVAVGLLGVCLGWLVLFLVTNRSNIYLGSTFEVKSDVSNIVDKPDTGNEFIYGAGTILSTERRDHYFWMRRYLAQILVRPIPSAIWPTKYEDFGVPELLHNAGTGEGFGDALGWVGAVGSAPGIVADLWVELWWLAVPAMAVLGWCYGFVWKKAVTRGAGWSSQYVILSALSIYLVMQTMEAVIFRTLLLSIPCWLTWRWALRAPDAEDESDAFQAYEFHARSVEHA
jgi:hypothetical protein